MSSSVQNLLSGVRRGSTNHLRRLRENWPHSRSVECSDAILSHLKKERQRADIQQDDLESIQLYTHTIVRFAMDSAMRSTNPHLKRELVDLLIPRIDVLVAPMSLCLRAIDIELRDTGDFDADETLRIHITRYCAHLMISMSYDPRLLHAIQASLVASDFFALTWTWIDPRTQLPLFLGEERREAAITKGCIVNIAFQLYTRGSTVARTNVLSLLDENEPAGAAHRLARLATQRARAMALSCRERLKLDPLVFARNLNVLMDVFHQFLRRGDPIIISVFRAHAFVRATTAGWTAVYDRLRDKKSKQHYWPLHKMVLKLEAWSAFDGLSPLKSMRQSIQGGLLSIFLEIVSHISSGAGDDQAHLSLKAIGAWIIPYAAYPSVNSAMAKAWASLDNKTLQAITEIKDREVVNPWFMLETWLRLYQSRSSELPSPKMCDNAEHPNTIPSSDEPTDKIKTCGSCHSTIYCSKLCQAADWKLRHRSDCGPLTKINAEHRLSHTWVDTTARLFLFSTLQGAFRTSFGHIESARQETHPKVPSTDLVVTYDFVRVSSYPEQEPSLSTVAEWVALIKERGVSVEDGIGLKRFDAVIQEFSSRRDFRLVEGRFKLGGRSLWVVARMRVPEDYGATQPDQTTLIGGISYYGPRIRDDSDEEEDRDHE